MPRYVTVSEIRAACGIDSGFIDDTDFNQLITSAEYTVERLANTTFIPTTIIEQYEGDGSERLQLRRNPVLKIRALTIDDTSITPEYTRLDKQSGTLWLTTSAEKSYFKSKTAERNLIRVKYDYGLLDLTTTQTTSSSATTAGSTVSITVADSSSFSVGDYVEIEGMDSYKETFKITVIADSTHITANNLAYPHESGSLLTKSQTPEIVNRLMRVAASLAGVARVVGQSFDEITGYSIPELSIQKGEPYTQWRETATQLRVEWKELWKSFRIRPAIY